MLITRPQGAGRPARVYRYRLPFGRAYPTLLAATDHTATATAPRETVGRGACDTTVVTKGCCSLFFEYSANGSRIRHTELYSILYRTIYFSLHLGARGRKGAKGDVATAEPLQREAPGTGRILVLA